MTLYNIVRATTQKRIITSHIKIKNQMKLKKLFLASIAVAAMTACSNETEFLDNGNQTSVKDASMQFGIALPKGPDTRAGEGVAGDTETGIASENAFVDITVVIDYASTRDVFTFGFDEFTKSNGENNQMLYLKNNISVAAGEATVSAFVNASEALKTDLKAKKTALSALKVIGNYTSSIDDLAKSGGIAEANKFLMSGSETNQKINSGVVNRVTVPVDRVAAKLVEKSKTNFFTITDPTVSTVNNDALTITLNEYNFANLLQDTYTLKNSGVIESKLFNAYSTAPFTTWDNYGTPKQITGATGATDISNITYCTENQTATTTNVLYKAVAKWGDNEASTFYVDADKIVYLTFAELSTKYDYEELKEDSGIEVFAKYGIKKYENGVCYYKSNKIGSITRNNVYYLNVTSIADLGTPTPGETPNPSTINLTVAMQPWTINIVDIEL